MSTPTTMSTSIRRPTALADGETTQNFACRFPPEPAPEDTVVGDFRVLAPHGFGVRLYEAIGGPLHEVRDATFPLPARPNPSRRADLAPIPSGMTVAGRHRPLLGTAAGAVDRRACPSTTPMVVVGARRDLRLFAETAAGLNYTTILRRPPGSIGRLTRLVRRHLGAPRARRSRALASFAPGPPSRASGGHMTAA
jgi:hypothetical protein